MYCIECGAQIPVNSKFCSHCGQNQTEGATSIKEQIVEKIIETEIVKQAVEEHKRNLDYELLKKTMGWYLAWIVLHLSILLIASNSIFGIDSVATDAFWPFGSEREGKRIGEYDIREFLFYSIFPLAILIIWSMMSAQNSGTEAKEANEEDEAPGAEKE